MENAGALLTIGERIAASAHGFTLFLLGLCTVLLYELRRVNQARVDDLQKSQERATASQELLREVTSVLDAFERSVSRTRIREADLDDRDRRR